MAFSHGRQCILLAHDQSFSAISAQDHGATEEGSPSCTRCDGGSSVHTAETGLKMVASTSAWPWWESVRAQHQQQTST